MRRDEVRREIASEKKRKDGTGVDEKREKKIKRKWE